MAYKIVRFYARSFKRRVIDRGLTLEEAKAHCERKDTAKPGVYFDGFEKE